MPSDTGDLDKYLKSIGEKPIAEMSTEPPKPAAAAPSEPYQGILAPGPMEGVQRGVAKGAAELGVGAARLAGKGIGLVSPNAQSELGELAQRVPGAKQLQEFADRPYADPGEMAGDIGLNLATAGGVGATRLPGLVKGLAGRIAPTSQYVRGVGWIPTRFGRVAAGAGTATEAAAKGAVGGAIADPDDPGTGAAVGAAGGVVPGAVSKALQGRAGQYLGGSLARSVAGVAVPAAVGYAVGGKQGAEVGGGLGLTNLVHHGLRHTVVSYHSPMGQWLHKFGKGLFDKGGRLIGWINPTTGGFVAAQIAGSGAPKQAYDRYTTSAPTDESDTQ
jgi:hypothetical protein